MGTLEFAFSNCFLKLILIEVIMIKNQLQFYHIDHQSRTIKVC